MNELKRRPKKAKGKPEPKPEPEPKPNVSKTSKASKLGATKAPTKTAVETFEAFEASDLELFHDPDGVPYSTYKNGNRIRTCPIDSSEYRKFIRYTAFLHGMALKNSDVTEIVSIRSAAAEFSSSEHPVFLRVAPHGADIFVDLCNEQGQAVQITERDWTIVDKPECKFRRAKGMRPLPLPTRGGDIHKLDKFLNLERNDRILFLSLLLSGFRYGKPTPITLITGEHGSAKTSLARIYRRLIDPSSVLVQTAPRGERDLQIACNNSWVMNIDNQSRLTDAMSDDLCRLATGSGLRTRSLYTNADEQIFAAIRPTLLNSIEELTTRPDFLDRTVHLHTRRLTVVTDEDTFWGDFDLISPEILGVLFTAVSAALKNIRSVFIESLPRMADFAKWSAAGATALGFTPAEFLNAYAQNRQVSVVSALDASPLYLPLHKLLDDGVGPKYSGRPITAGDGKFIGSTKDLLEGLESTHVTQQATDWPRSAAALRSALDRIIPNLRADGIEVKRGGRDPVRRVQILEITKTYSAEEIEVKKAKAAAIAKDIENRALAAESTRTAAEAKRLAERETRRAAKNTECAEWLKSVLKSGPARNKALYAMASNFSKDQINNTAIAIGVREEIRPDGKFWSLPEITKTYSDAEIKDRSTRPGMALGLE